MLQLPASGADETAPADVAAAGGMQQVRRANLQQRGEWSGLVRRLFLRPNMMVVDSRLKIA